MRWRNFVKPPMPSISCARGHWGCWERGHVPGRFILHIDGVGSFLVLRRPIVSIGSVSSDARPDLGLIAEPSLPGAVIERVEEDYFIRGGALQINGRPMQEKLLSSGDRLALSPRCRMTFRLPSGASTSALLELDGARLPRGDVRHVILLDRELIIGPGSSAHVRVDSLEQPIVMHVRQDHLICGREKLALGQHVSIGNVSLVVTDADAGR
jgi:hypothetical protein